MWSLVPLSDDKPETVQQEQQEPTIWLSCGRKYTIGRKGCDITIETDKSISRNHAEIVVDQLKVEDIGDTGTRPKISIVDLSKYGTYVNGTKCPKMPVELQDGAIIRVGVYSTFYKLRFVPFVFCPSRIKLSNDEKAMIAEIGGHLVEKWSPTITHLLMKEVSATEKVALALISGIPIVGVQFIDAIKKRDSCMKPLPDASRFLPPITTDQWQGLLHNAEPDFRVNKNRSSVFKGKSFVFVSHQQYAKNVNIVTAGKGTAVDASTQEIDMDFFVKYRNACVMCDESEADEALQDKFSKLKEQGFQLVEDTEILAKIVAMDEAYCNPKAPNDDYIKRLEEEKEKKLIKVKEEPTDEPMTKANPAKPAAQSQPKPKDATIEAEGTSKKPQPVTGKKKRPAEEQQPEDEQLQQTKRSRDDTTATDEQPGIDIEYADLMRTPLTSSRKAQSSSGKTIFNAKKFKKNYVAGLTPETERPKTNNSNNQASSSSSSQASSPSNKAAKPQQEAPIMATFYAEDTGDDTKIFMSDSSGEEDDEELLTANVKAKKAKQPAKKKATTTRKTTKKKTKNRDDSDSDYEED